MKKILLVLVCCLITSVSMAGSIDDFAGLGSASGNISYNVLDSIVPIFLPFDVSSATANIFNEFSNIFNILFGSLDNLSGSSSL